MGTADGGLGCVFSADSIGATYVNRLNCRETDYVSKINRCVAFRQAISHIIPRLALSYALTAGPPAMYE